MKKLLLKGSVFVVYFVLLEIIFPMIVDPFNVFHVGQVRATGVSPNNKYIKMKYILNHKDMFDGYTFIFGSSRVGFISSDKMPEDKIYNMEAAAALPIENLANLKTLLNAGIRPSKIDLGVDSLSYTTALQHHIYAPMYCPYEYLHNHPLHFLMLYMNPATTIHALGIVLTKKPSEKNPNPLYTKGTAVSYGTKTQTKWSTAGPSLGHVPVKDIPESVSNTLNDIKEFAELCRTSGIELVIFTNPMHHITYKASVKLSYFEFLEGLAEISDFWNFSSLSDVTLSNDLYLETSHYKAEVGDMMIDFMCNGRTDPELQAQGFGLKVTRDNIKDFIGVLKKQADTFTQNS